VPPEPVGEADAGERAPANPFRRGAVRLTLVLGTGSTVRDEYLILGGGLGYYLLDGAELGVDYEAWIMGSPVMQRLSPELRYVLHFVPLIKPYVGVFYRHAFINDYDDIDSVGGRLGVYYVTPRGRVYIGGGAVYDHMLDCAASTFVECDTIYPEISIGASL
jgi:hypothetical protein